MSRFLTPADVTVPAAEASFTQIEEVPSRGHNLLLKARRYGRWWMLKGLKEAYRKQTAYRVMLQKEFEISVALQHPGIVTVSSFEEVADYGHCIVMEWIDGETLSAWMEAQRPSRAMRRQVFLQLLEAVAYVHSRQVAHRDLKPSNVLITRNGQQVKLIDFGLSDADCYAILKQPAGTPGYFSPEQERSHLTDLRNDVYSLGVLLQELRLGWRVRGVLRRCKKPLMKRYENVAALRRAFRCAEHTPYYIIGACVLLAVGAMLFKAEGLRLKAEVEAPQENEKLEVRNEELKESNEKLGVSTEELEETNVPSAQAHSSLLTPKSSLSPKPYSLEEGKRWLDQQMAACGVAEKLDTLSAAGTAAVEEELLALIEATNAAIHDYAARHSAHEDAITLENFLLLYVSDHYYRPWILRIDAARRP